MLSNLIAMFGSSLANGAHTMIAYYVAELILCYLNVRPESGANSIGMGMVPFARLMLCVANVHPKRFLGDLRGLQLSEAQSFLVVVPETMK